MKDNSRLFAAAADRAVTSRIRDVPDAFDESRPKRFLTVTALDLDNLGLGRDGSVAPWLRGSWLVAPWLVADTRLRNAIIEGAWRFAVKMRS
ncbi:MAG TPA: hypothetical protein VJX67_09390 [Blastocatellia bacterium]|nr:hypothetical protein [Blastocatellia bacterium]